MTSNELRALRDRTGVPYGSLDAINVQIRQLAKNGLSRGQIIHAIGNLHPKLMENLTIGAEWVIQRRDSRYGWERRKGWVKH